MTITTYRNKRNKHKYFVLKHYECGHYYFCPYMKWDNGVINLIGQRNRCYRRIRKSTIAEIMEDYTEV